MPLTDTRVRALHGRMLKGEKAGKKSDGGGLNVQDGKYRHNVMDVQLAHGGRNKVRDANNHVPCLPERTADVPIGSPAHAGADRSNMLVYL